MSVIIISNASGGGGGMVDSVTAGDDSIVIGGTASEPTVETGTLDQIATLHPPVAAVAMNGEKITGLANGTASTDAAAYGQLAAYAPLASPALTGTPTAPTQAALTNNTDIATTAYADAAVAVETTRAEAAEALALPLAGGTMSGAIAMGSNKITGLTNGSGAQDAAAYGQTLGGGKLAPLTTEGDLLYANATPAPARLAIGAANTSLQSNGSLPSWQPAMALLATTGTTPYTLVNGTGNIITWTAPNDGALHRVLLIATLYVSSAETGGSINMAFTLPNGTSAGAPQVMAGGQSGGTKFPSASTFLVEANTTITLEQASALSGGAAVLWAELWGS
jgi:hypothetical protein